MPTPPPPPSSSPLATKTYSAEKSIPLIRGTKGVSVAVVTVIITFDQLTKWILPTIHTSTRSHPALSLLVLAGLSVVFFRSHPRFRLPLTLIIAGGLANLLDHLFFPGIRDPFQLLTLTFNVADAVIMVGVIYAAGRVVEGSKE